MAGKGLQAEAFYQNLQNKPIGCKETFYKQLLIIMSRGFWYQPFVAVSGNLGGKFTVIDDVLWPHAQIFYPTTSLDENCIEFRFQRNWNFKLICDRRIWL